MKPVWVVGVLFCLSCDDGGSGSTSSGVKGSIKLRDVSTAQAASVCRALVRYDYSKYSVRDDCTEDAVYETTELTECKAYVDECVRDKTEDLSSDREEDLEECETKDPNDEDDHQDLPANCDFTVAEYEQCIRAEIDGYVRAAREASCLDAGEAGDEDYIDSEPASDECQELFEACGI